MSTKGPVKGTRIAGLSYYLVKAEGKRRIWIKLSRVKDGLPAFYRALADANEGPAGDSMPALCADWQRDVMPRHAAKTQRDETAMCKTIAASFEAFTAAQVRPPDVADFLRPFASKPRTFNGHRAMLRELMRYAEERGHREPGSNPVTALRTMSTPARTRYITDSELRRIKVAGVKGLDGKNTRSGPMLCALVDMAYLTGQRIGDLLTLEWAQLGRDGIAFKTAKTGAAVLIEWTPRLRDVERRLKALRVKRAGFAPQLFTTQDGKAYTYWGASTAWRRACERAGIKCHFHDIRARALTDKDRAEGIGQAQRMAGHSTQTQTRAYVRHKTAIAVKATR